MFGIPGGAIMPTYDAMAHGSTVRHVLARHEQGAGHMAEGYARASGKVGVAIATSGPGATNLVTPIADAWMDSTPLVCITGQVRTHLIGTDAFQECDITGVTMPIVKHSWLVQDVQGDPAGDEGGVPRRSHRTLRAGARRRATRRAGGRAGLRLPGRPSTCPAGGHPRRGIRSRSARRRGRSPQAEKPVLYVGGGTLNADACDELLTLAEAGRLPVITTLMGKSAFPESHELHFGWPGMHGAEVVEHRHEHLRRARRGRRALRRPRHREARRVRTGRDRRPSRHRRGRDLEAARGGHPRGRPAEGGPAGARHEIARAPRGRCGRPRGMAAAHRRLARRVPAPLRLERRVDQAAVGRSRRSRR